eukprot:TRINITY_DN9704_c0_g7_i1.p1 TRINITY_DN9704_c0_g7~~TRINITY_DN9704_c0_g7_i1.p1  ORF type:complete len:591 (-),score=78.07 TRINITY_DN9704_c0_g7_i1:52-1710(-)
MKMLDLREAKRLFYFSNMLDSHPAATSIKLLEKIIVSPQCTVQSYSIKLSSSKYEVLKTYTFSQLSKEKAEKIRANFELAKPLWNSHVNLSKLICFEIVEDLSNLHIEVLYEDGGNDIVTLLKEQEYSLQSMFSVAQQIASAFAYIHSKEVRTEEFSMNSIKTHGETVKLPGFLQVIPARIEEVKVPRVQIAERLESREAKDVFLWSDFMLRTCLRCDYDAEYKSQDEYEESIKKLKKEIEKSVPADFASVLIRCMEFDSSKRPTFKEILEELSKIPKHKSANAAEVDALSERVIEAYSVDIKGKKVALSEHQIFAMQNLDESSLISISNALANNAPLISLNLDSNGIEERGIEIISKGLAMNCTLKSLTLSNNSIEDKNIKTLISSMPKSITTLDLSNNKLTEAAAHSISSIIDRLLTLNVANNQLSDSGVEQLCKAIALNEGFSSLDVGSNKLTDKSCSLLSKTISSHKAFETLCVDGNDVTDVGAHALSEAIAKSLRFHTLYIGRNKITDIGARSLSDAIRQSFGFKKINLYGNLLTEWGYDLIFNARK